MKAAKDDRLPKEDDVLRRMLMTPPDPKRAQPKKPARKAGKKTDSDAKNAPG